MYENRTCNASCTGAVPGSSAEKRFREWEEEKWKRENEIEEMRRREDREHEFRMLQMLMQASNQPSLYAPYSSMPTYSCPSQPYSKEDDY